MTASRTPAHSLEAVQMAVRQGRWRATTKVYETAAAVLCDTRAEIEECICALTPRQFRKSMPSEKWQGRWLDVYKTHYGGIPIYIKFDYDAEADLVSLRSFKLDEDP